MDNEKEAERKIAQIRELAKEDKDIDVAALMIDALEQSQRSEVEAKRKRRAYIVSLALPPFGLIFAARYFLSEKSDGRRVALICVILTAFSLVASWLILKAFLDSAGPQLQQLQTINPDDYKDLL